eukprot:scaffold184527_cov53-Attheya_sp.AAC.1
MSDEASSRGPRFGAWSALMVFSMVSLIAFCTDSTVDLDNLDRAGKWVLSCTVISMSVAFIAVVGHIVAGAIFVGKMPESVSSSICTLMWCFGLPYIMRPSYGFATGPLGGVINANLYFSSWASFVAAIYVSGGLSQEAKIADLTVSSAKVFKWYALVAASLVLMVTTSNVSLEEELRFQDVNCKGDIMSSVLEEFCRRTKWGISLGVIGAVVAFVTSLMITSGRASVLIEVISSFTMFVMYIFGISYITFGTLLQSPGTTIGNMYFATWAGFYFSMSLFFGAMAEMRGKKASNSDDVGVEASAPETKEEVAEVAEVAT